MPRRGRYRVQVRDYTAQSDGVDGHWITLYEGDESARADRIYNAAVIEGRRVRLRDAITAEVRTSDAARASREGVPA